MRKGVFCLIEKQFKQGSQTQKDLQAAWDSK